jgi:hypothetical protein
MREGMRIHARRVTHDEEWARRQSVGITTTSPRRRIMMRSSRSSWLSGIGAVVLSGGLLVSSYGTGATAAEAFTLVDPIIVFLSKLNPTLRWDTNNASDKRFTRAFPGAVLDKNTGLVWGAGARYR